MIDDAGDNVTMKNDQKVATEVTVKAIMGLGDTTP